MSSRGQSGKRRPAPPPHPALGRPGTNGGAARQRTDEMAHAGAGERVHRFGLGALGGPRQTVLTDKTIDLLRTVFNKTGSADETIKVINAISEMDMKARVIKAITAVVLSLVSATATIAVATSNPWAYLPIYILVGLLAIGCGVVVYVRRPLPGNPTPPLPESASGHHAGNDPDAPTVGQQTVNNRLD